MCCENFHFNVVSLHNQRKTRLEKIIFVEDGHRYMYKDSVLNSVTTEVGKYSETFNSMYQSRASAYKEILGEKEYLRYRKEIFGFNYRPDESILFPLFDEICGSEEVEDVQNKFLEKWRMSGVNGTIFHKDRENESYKRGYEINPFTGKSFDVRVLDKQFDNESWGLNLFSIPDGYYSEFIVFDNLSPLEKTLCGTIDRMWVETDYSTGIRYTDTSDYKTNSDPPKNSKYNKMYPPLNHLWANKINDYNLQASLYQNLLSTHGFTPRRSSFEHFTDYDVTQVIEYPLTLLKDEAQIILDNYRKKS